MRRLGASLLTALALVLVASAAASAASPTVTTLSASPVGRTTATPRLAVNPQGLATTYAFQWGTTTAYGTQTASRDAGNGTTTLTKGIGIAGLTAGTTYHYRAVATNADGTTFGADHTLKTTPPPVRRPTVLATAPFAPTANGVAFTALINPNGATTTYRFQYGTSTAYGLETFSRSIPGSTAPISVQFRINSLAPHLTYHFRVVATNRGGTTVGPDTTAQTGPFPPASLTAATGPHVARRSHPFYVTRGVLRLAPGVSPAQGCSGGTITVRFTSGRHTVARASTTLHGGHCSYRLRMRVLPAPGVHRLRVRASFAGNAILTRTDARTFLVGMR
jgi:hypothetical protein